MPITRLSIKVVAVSFMLVFLASWFYAPAKALSIAYCNEDTIECKVQNCHSSNQVARFDGRTDSVRDCSELETKLKLQQAAVMGAVLVVLGGLSVLVVKKYKRKK